MLRQPGTHHWTEIACSCLLQILDHMNHWPGTVSHLTPKLRWLGNVAGDVSGRRRDSFILRATTLS